MYEEERGSTRAPNGFTPAETVFERPNLITAAAKMDYQTAGNVSTFDGIYTAAAGINFDVAGAISTPAEDVFP